MKTTFVSTSAMANATRRSVLQMQSELTTLQKEVTTGRAADVGLALGARTGTTVALRQESASLESLLASNAVAGTRLSTTQTTLDAIATDAGDFLSILMTAKGDESSPEATASQAKQMLASLTGSLNATQGGAYLFAGINTDTMPIADYSAPGSPAKQAVADAFLAHFGFSQADPAVSGIAAADMQDFLDNEFAALFDDPAWSATWSSASDQVPENRISPTQSVVTGVSANDPSMRKLAMAATMVADLGLSAMSSETYGAVIGKASGLVGEATLGLTATQAALGYSQHAVSAANDRMSAQKDVLDTHIGTLEGIDPYEASTRINNLLTQIETSYALTARIQQLSLLDFIS